MSERRGRTLRYHGRAFARVMIPSGRVRFGWDRSDDRLIVSLGFLIVTWWGFR